MRWIPRHYCDLYAGLVRAREYNHRLQVDYGSRRGELEKKLKVDYQRRHGQYVTGKAAWDAIERAANRKRIPAILCFVLALIFFCQFGGSLLTTSFKTGGSVFLDYLAVFVYFAVTCGSVFFAIRFWRQIAAARRKAAAAHPGTRFLAPNPRKTGAYLSPAPPVIKTLPNLELMDEWWRRILTDKDEVLDNPPYGYTGEMALMEALTALDDQYYAVHGAMVSGNLDSDMLVFGPSGIWILESKYWSGKITYANGHWFQTKTFYAPGGKLNQDQKPVEDIHAQWKRERDFIERRLKEDLPGWNGRLLGGLVFTHPNVTLEIDPSCPASCGPIGGWVKKIKAEKTFTAMTEQMALTAMDTILTASRSYRNTRYGSSIQVAEDIYLKRVKQLAEL